ncbi:MAG: TraR/DksA C4-type zinc finger protein [Cycloclasticus sp.]|nr:TraR/DksA C4-type zinc finger protein [Cycloclasticus sp.]MBQ0790392.1 TraR/DksA C4-type zinc finger protein [Cycloclasticus sp.]
MNDSDIEKLKQDLLGLKQDLQLQEDEFQAVNEPIALDQARVGRLSRIDAMQEQQMSLETSRRRQQHLVQVDGALNRIQTDDFGFCYICGEQIDERRLLLEPTATRCIPCTESNN